MADSIIDVEDEMDTRNSKDTLQFRDIPHDDDLQSKNGVQTHTFSKFPPNAQSDEEDDATDGDKTELLASGKQSPSFWTFDYYQQFFDVDSRQVMWRVAGSMMPHPRRNYLRYYIRPNPDLYGPFWICTTLVFTTAIAGNMANYIQSGGKDYQWSYDFHKVSFAATAVFSYWWVIPTLLFGLLWWRRSEAGYTFLEIISVYGYSLAIYIPISILLVVQINWLQWILVIVGACLSGGVLLLTFWPALREDNKKLAIIVMALIFLFHATLAVGFVLYFLHAPTHASSNMTTIKPGGLTTTLPQKAEKQLQQLQSDKPPITAGAQVARVGKKIRRTKSGDPIKEDTQKTGNQISENPIQVPSTDKKTGKLMSGNQNPIPSNDVIQADLKAKSKAVNQEIKQSDINLAKSNINPAGDIEKHAKKKIRRRNIART